MHQRVARRCNPNLFQVAIDAVNNIDRRMKLLIQLLSVSSAQQASHHDVAEAMVELRELSDSTLKSTTFSRTFMAMDITLQFVHQVSMNIFADAMRLLAQNAAQASFQ